MHFLNLAYPLIFLKFFQIFTRVSDKIVSSNLILCLLESFDFNVVNFYPPKSCFRILIS